LSDGARKAVEQPAAVRRVGRRAAQSFTQQLQHELVVEQLTSRHRFRRRVAARCASAYLAS
jgi:hypothetical protein